MSWTALYWLMTAMIMGLSIGWGVYDSRKLFRLLKETDKRGDLAHRDKIFGSIVGLALCALGVSGVIKYHMGW